MAVSVRQRLRFRRDLAAIKRGGGVRFVKHSGYSSRGRPGPFTPVGVMVHHDATAKGPSEGVIPLLVKGRADLPGPLYNLWIARNGTVHVIAAGRCNHAGTGWSSWTGRDGGNSRAYAVCLDLTVGEGMTQAQTAALTRVTAALLAKRGRWARRMIGHKEYQPGKVDPAIPMDKARRRVNKRIRHLRRSLPWFRRRWAKVRKARDQAV